MSRMSSSQPTHVQTARERYRAEGRQQERERIVGWLRTVEKSLDVEPTAAEPVGEELGPEEKRGAQGILTVLIENLENAS